jgi:hypothetical protein
MLVFALVAAVVLLATCGAGVLGLNLLTGGGTTSGGTTTVAHSTVTATQDDLPTETLAPTSTTGPGTPTSTLAPTWTPKPSPTPTSTHVPTPTDTPAYLNVSPTSLNAGTCASPTYGAGVTVSNTGQTPLNWTTTSDDVVSASPPSGNGVIQGSPQTVSFTGAPTGTIVHVTFKNSANPSNQATVTITCT